MRHAACQRCRAKKIKCEGTRPCFPCRKASLECVSRGVGLSTAMRPLLPTGSATAAHSGPAILQESSILDLSKSLLDRDVVHLPGHSVPSAIPGGHGCTSQIEPLFFWRNDLPFKLPSQAVLDALAQQYFNSVNWFMHVIDEKSFSSAVAEYTATESSTKSKRNSYFLMSLIWGLGAHYLWTDPLAQYDRGFLATFSQDTLHYVETNFLLATAHPDLECVQIGILLGSFHLFNGSPNLGFGVLGSTTKTAQLLGLHRGFHTSSTMGRGLNSCAKVWWALEIFEKYAATAFGRPCGIDDSDCNVPEIQIPPDDQTRMSYHQEKCRLYRIIGPFLGRRRECKASASLPNVHTQLRTRFANLPRKLKVAQRDSVETNMELEEMQALALQMAYDNIQIVLHRQAVFVSRPSQASDSDWQNDASIEQLVESALRTTNVPDHKAIFSMCRSTHAAMHVGICLFTAGVVLSGLHLGHGAVRQSNELLVALDRIISFFRIFPGEAYSLVPQCLHILETLQLRCNETLRSDRPSSQGVGSDETKTELAGSILESTAWTNDDFSYLANSEELNASSLLDYASGVSLDAVAQSWLWTDSEATWPINREATE